MWEIHLSKKEYHSANNNLYSDAGMSGIVKTHWTFNFFVVPQRTCALQDILIWQHMLWFSEKIKKKSFEFENLQHKTLAQFWSGSKEKIISTQGLDLLIKALALASRDIKSQTADNNTY